MREMTHFAAEWLRNPARMGAVAPSSAGLARTITDGLSRDSGPVVELGPGTGVFTERMFALGVQGAQLAAVEANHALAALLAERYPGVTIRQGDAARVRSLVPFDPGTVQTVICGLPLLSMPFAHVFRILRNSFDLLTANGEFRLFTYGPTCPVPHGIQERLGLRSEMHDFVVRNLPPATVYSLRREGR
ncbi:class I SAM-dependent methyltransferase [Roseibium sp.]|uniref:class I SAM-dependent methyltransferase n=1 Tax=Roseibium sp. TaxID=1936156 RepID=UPI003D0CB244